MAMNMNEKNFMKYLPRVGGTVALTMAMAAALATPANASEVAEGTADPTVEIPVAAAVEASVPAAEAPAPAAEAPAPVAAAAPAPAAETPAPAAETPPAIVIVAPEEVPAVNTEIAQSNNETAAENSATAEQNTSVDAGNNAAAAENSTATGGELSAPELPDIPQAPEAPEVPVTDDMNTDDKNAAVEDYNDQVGEYNDQVDDYNDAASDYNDKADDYNAAADAFDQQEQDRYETEEQEYNDYLDEQQAYEDAQKAYEEEVAQQEAEHNAEQDRLEEEHNQTELENEAAHEAEQDRLEAEHNAEQDRLEQEHNQTELDTYEEEKKAAEEAHKAEQEAAEEAHNKAEAEREAAFEAEKQAAEDAHNAQQEELEEQHYEAEWKEYEEEMQAAQNAHDAAQKELEEQHNAQQDALEEQHNAEQDALEDAYEAEKKVYEDAVAKENQIYDIVTDYNGKIEIQNGNIDSMNDALENDLHADLVTSIEDVGEINEGVTNDEALLETLKNYSDLADRQKALEDAAAALETHTGKDAALGSAEYAEYLAAVEAYNNAVTQFNADAEAYNDAVTVYNAAVEAYNQNKINNSASTPSTGSGTQQDSADIDWGNVEFNGNFDNIEEDHLTHIDVKYNAAASKEVTVEYDENGNKNETYSDSVTQYTVTGVFTDKETADRESGEQDPSYGLSYSNDGWNTSDTQALKKDGANDEFGNTSWNHTGENLDPVTGQISFYVTLTDSAGKRHGITVNMDAGSVYAKGSYYKAEENDFLENYVGKDDKTLTTVTIDGVEYYDVSGESVFLISALTCDGMTEGGYYTGSGWNRKFVSDGTLNAHGLDLILNLQTMIEIHQSENAQKIGYLSYQLGKTAQAEKVERETYEELYGEFQREEFIPTPFTPEPFEYDKEYTPDPFTPAPFEYDKEFTPTPFTPTPFEYDKEFNPTPYERTEYERTEYTPTEFVPEEFEAPEYKGPEKPDEVAPPRDIIETERLEHLELLDKLEDLLYFVAEQPTVEPPDTDPTPPVVEEEPVSSAPAPVVLADVPKTGDVSALWAALSGLSLGAISLLNRKRRDRK